MSTKHLPMEEGKLLELARRLPTPFYLYDEKAILENAEAFRREFSWAPSFRDYFAVKALPNPAIVKLLAEKEGFGCDCSSLPELYIAEASGVKGRGIMLTSNDTPVDEFAKALELGAVINLDDISHIDFLPSLPEMVSFRYNPGPERTGNAIIGNPVEAKYGVPKDKIVECYRIMKEKGVRHFALHTMVASNELDAQYIVETARMLFALVGKIHDEAGVRIELIDLGGGVGIPYRPEQTPNDIAAIGEGVRKVYEEVLTPAGMGNVALFTEMGRFVTGPYGGLVTKVLHFKHIYKEYVGVDACAANLMRPAMYGAYHHITVLGKENEPCDHTYDVTGGLCENNDKFAIDRKLPKIDKGDYLFIHDTGAHGSAMGYNYNAKLWCAELLLKEDGSVELLRRAETEKDYFATLDFTGLFKDL